MTYIAFITKGIGTISIKELSQLEGLTIISTHSKYIKFEYDKNPSDLKDFRTIDDISLFIEEIPSQDLLNLKLDLNLIQKTSIPFISNFRNLTNEFSITVSNYKFNEIHRDDLKLKLQQFLADELKLNYSPLDHSNIDFRINIEEDKAFISIKLFPESLFQRNYIHTPTLGSLRSTIAASMIYEILAKVGKKEDLNLVDNFCGSGTFLCEGYLMGLNVSGGDIKDSSLKLARENLIKAGVENPNIKLQSAIKTDWPRGSFDIAVSNFPWNKRVPEKNLNELYAKSIKEYSRILKKDGAIGLIGIKPSLIRKSLETYFPNHKIEEYTIGHLGQTPRIFIAFTDPATSTG